MGGEGKRKETDVAINDKNLSRDHFLRWLFYLCINFDLPHRLRFLMAKFAYLHTQM